MFGIVKLNRSMKFSIDLAMFDFYKSKNIQRLYIMIIREERIIQFLFSIVIQEILCEP